jgi:hypothetical protein
MDTEGQCRIFLSRFGTARAPAFAARSPRGRHPCMVRRRQDRIPHPDRLRAGDRPRARSVFVGSPTLSALARVPKRARLFDDAFRPFYLGGSTFAALAVMLWLGAWYHGYLPPSLPGLFWHVHEMVFGFAGAIIVGFLFTAAQNWTGLPLPKGAPLGVVFGLWVAARFGMFFAYSPASAAVDVSVLLVVAGVLASRFVRARSWCSMPLVGVLLALGVTNGVFHASVLGWGGRFAAGGGRGRAAACRADSDDRGWTRGAGVHRECDSGRSAGAPALAACELLRAGGAGPGVRRRQARACVDRDRVVPRGACGRGPGGRVEPPRDPDAPDGAGSARVVRVDSGGARAAGAERPWAWCPGPRRCTRWRSARWEG